MEPKSPKDRATQRDAAIELTKRVAIWAVPLSLISALLIALGLPWWIVALAIVMFVLYLLFEA